MNRTVRDFEGIPVLVCGDVMLDRHVHGQVRRISPEAPVPVVSLLREECAPGGAGHVAASMAGLGCRVTLAGLIGDDPEGLQLRRALAGKGVARVVTAGPAGLTTVTKTRILSESHQQMLRLDRDGRRDAFAAAAPDLLARVLPRLGRFRAVVLSDYDKGVVTPDLASALIRRCRERGVPCVVDPKRPDLSAFAGATVLAPNLPEAERAIGQPLEGDQAIGEAAAAVRDRLGLDAMLITRGADGMTLAAAGPPVQIPAQARAVADVTGAGDTVVATLAACIAAGWPMADACRLASVAAGIAVSHPGTYVVRASELEPAWRGDSTKVLDRASARHRVDDARRAGRQVVFTNGCFDVLHAGHLSSLERARALGDLLVVGLNSDASVRRLKGESRPVNTQRDRAALLAGLSCVDLVVVFDEPTPERLIQTLEPDVLVKGGDYTVETIAGADFVLARGGRVVTLPLVPGLSTTAILARRA
jgi:D-beta-D-heptose 7-phosphate kinase/D-beta-D-heptose 1-phosphate adenosyltransferase